jgi:hypothetical protein
LLNERFQVRETSVTPEAQSRSAFFDGLQHRLPLGWVWRRLTPERIQEFLQRRACIEERLIECSRGCGRTHRVTHGIQALLQANADRPH